MQSDIAPAPPQMDALTPSTPAPSGSRKPVVASFAAAALVAAYAAAMLPNILSSNYAPDEIWFSIEAFRFNAHLGEVGAWRYIVEQRNHLGYGPIYWMLQTCFTHFFTQPLVASRCFSLVCLLAVPISLLASCSRSLTPNRWLAWFLWLTFPVAWWTGKLTGPELPSMAAGAIGLACLTYPDTSRRLIGWTALGVAVGIKATAVPLLVFAGILLWGSGTSWLGFASTAAAGTAVGFVLSSPTVLFAPGAFLAAIRAAKGRDPLEVPSWYAHITARLNAESWTWDALPNGGLMQWSLSAVPLLAFTALLLWGKDKGRIQLAFAGAAALSIALCLTSQQYYGWYWFATLLIFPFAWMAEPSWSKTRSAFASALVALNAACNAPTIAQHYALKMEQQRITQDKVAIQTCIAQAAGGLSGIDTVIDYSELYLDLNFDFLTRAGSLDKPGIVPPGQVASWLMGIAPLPPLGKEAFMVIGERLKSVHAPGVLAKDLAAKVAGAVDIEFIHSCSGMQLYRLGLRKT